MKNITWHGRDGSDQSRSRPYSPAPPNNRLGIFCRLGREKISDTDRRSCNLSSFNLGGGISKEADAPLSAANLHNWRTVRRIRTIPNAIRSGKSVIRPDPTTDPW